MRTFLNNLKYSPLYELLLPIFQELEKRKWEKNHFGIPPHIVKQSIIKGFAQKYEISTFIETGTYLGVMVNAMKKDFSKIYTVEVDRKLFQRAKKKFKKTKHIHTLLGDSGTILPKLLKKITGPALFWLDAHYSSGITSKGFKDTPIVEELKSILKHRPKHIILIDDANCFIGKNDYPTLKFLKNFVKKTKKYSMAVKENIIRIIPI